MAVDKHTIISNPSDRLDGNDSWYRWSMNNPPNFDDTESSRIVIACFGDNIEDHITSLEFAIEDMLDAGYWPYFVLLNIPTNVDDVHKINGIVNVPTTIVMIAGMEIKRFLGKFANAVEYENFVSSHLSSLISVIEEIQLLEDNI